eukprot:gene13437-biopygen100
MCEIPNPRKSERIRDEIRPVEQQTSRKLPGSVLKTASFQQPSRKDPEKHGEIAKRGTFPPGIPPGNFQEGYPDIHASFLPASFLEGSLLTWQQPGNVQEEPCLIGLEASCLPGSFLEDPSYPGTFQVDPDPPGSGSSGSTWKLPGNIQAGSSWPGRKLPGGSMVCLAVLWGGHHVSHVQSNDPARGPAPAAKPGTPRHPRVPGHMTTRPASGAGAVVTLTAETRPDPRQPDAGATAQAAAAPARLSLGFQRAIGSPGIMDPGSAGKVLGAARRCSGDAPAMLGAAPWMLGATGAMLCSALALLWAAPGLLRDGHGMLGGDLLDHFTTLTLPTAATSLSDLQGSTIFELQFSTPQHRKMISITTLGINGYPQFPQFPACRSFKLEFPLR